MSDRSGLPAIGHVDDTGGRCARHAPVSTETLLHLAMVGSRASAFHHDCASKLQGLVMALDELSELSEHGDPQILRAVEAAMESTKELHALLNMNRALTKPPSKAATPLGELLAKGAQRVGVMLSGAIPAVQVEVAVPAMTHAFALVFDVAAGSGRGRSIALTATQTDKSVDLAIPTAGSPPSNASELLTIAHFVVGRDGGALWCAAGAERLTVRLPVV